MRYLTPVLALAGAAAGLAAAAGGYQLVSAPEATAPSGVGVAAVGRPVPAAPPRVIQRIAPCEQHARARDGVCVRHVWRTVVDDQAPATAGAQGGTAASGGNPSASPSYRTDDHGSRTDQQDDHHRDDHGSRNDDGPEHEDD